MTQRVRTGVAPGHERRPKLPHNAGGAQRGSKRRHHADTREGGGPRECVPARPARTAPLDADTALAVPRRRRATCLCARAPAIPRDEVAFHRELARSGHARGAAQPYAPALAEPASANTHAPWIPSSAPPSGTPARGARAQIDSRRRRRSPRASPGRARWPSPSSRRRWPRCVARLLRTGRRRERHARAAQREPRGVRAERRRRCRARRRRPPRRCTPASPPPFVIGDAPPARGAERGGQRCGERGQR